MDNTEYETSMH